VASDPDREQHTSDPRPARLHRSEDAPRRRYPYRYPTNRSVEQIRAAHSDLGPDQLTTDRVRIAGRLTLVRRQGGLTFAVLRDRTGELQLFADTAVLGAELHREFDECDRGDWVGVEGLVMTTRRGKLSVYHDMMDLTEGLISHAAGEALGGSMIVHYSGQEIDLTVPWPRVRFADMIAEKTGVTMHPAMPLDKAREVLDRLRIPYERSWGAGRLMKEIYDEKGQHDIVGPVFCIDYPREVSPLVRAHRDDPTYVESTRASSSAPTARPSRLPLPRRVRAGVRRSDRRPGVSAASARRVPAAVRRAGVESRVPRGPGG
jgi:lysyl-tRNA synthetase class II